MVQVTCQHSGIQFEAKTKRTKMHPKVARFKNSKTAVQNWGHAVAALDEVATSGEYQTVEEYVEQVKALFEQKLTAVTQAQQKRQQRQAEADKAAQELRDRRKARNAHLRQHGYRWQKHYINHFDHYEEPEPDDEYVWVLVAPDGRYDVPVAQALDEIERGAEVVLSEIEAAETAEAERKRQAEEAERKRQEEDRSRREAFEAQQLTGLTYVSFSLNLDDYVQDEAGTVYFESGWHTTGDTYIPISTKYGKGWLKHFGNMTVAYVPQQQANEWFANRWQEDQADPKAVLAILNKWLKYADAVYDSEYGAWLIDNIGEEALVEKARAGKITINKPGQSGHYALASKLYRIPVTVIDKEWGGDGKWEDVVAGIGYGNIQKSEGPEGWVKLGDEDAPTAVWPTSDDIAASRKESDRVATLFSNFFGG